MGITQAHNNLSRELLGDKPCLICTVAGVKFYEHPTLGDEAPLRAVLPNGNIVNTDFWDRPSRDEVLDWYSDVLAA